MPPNGVQKLISQNQEVKINATGPWPLDDLHLQYLNITFEVTPLTRFYVANCDPQETMGWIGCTGAGKVDTSV